MITLKATKRDAGGASASNIRAEGMIPAVVYGPKFTNTSIAINYQEFVRTYNKHGETTLIYLELDGKNIPALVHELSLNPVSNKVQHVDFYSPEAGKKVHAAVPLNFINESPAVKAGAQLVKVMHEVEVEALPENLPHVIDVDLSKIETIEHTITIADLEFPKGVECKLESDAVVASAAEAKEEVETAPVNLEEIEVEKKGKSETETESTSE